MADLDVAKLKVADLKSELQARGLPVSGLKAVLAERLQGAIDAEAATRAADAPANEDAVEQKTEDVKEVSGDIQDATEAPGPTELLEGADEHPAPTDKTEEPLAPDPTGSPSTVTPAETATLAPPSPSEVQHSHITPPIEGGLTFTSTNGAEASDGITQTSKRKRSPSADARASEAGAHTVEPPSVQAEEAMVANDEVPPPPADVAARMDTDGDERATKKPRVALPAEGSTSTPERGAGLSIRGAARQATQSPILDTHDFSSATPAASTSASHPSPSFFVSNLSRPCPDKDFEDMLSEYGAVQELYINKIKTHAIVILASNEAADKAITALQGVVWPDGGRSLHFRSLPSAQVAKELISFDKAAGGRNRFALHIDPATNAASLRTMVPSATGPGTGPRGLASGLPAGFAAGPSASLARPPPTPLNARPDVAASALLPAAPASYELHRPDQIASGFRRTSTKPQLYYKEASPPPPSRR